MTFDIENDLITATSPANPDPILWDPATMASRQLTATVDQCYQCTWEVKVEMLTSSQDAVRSYTWHPTVGPGPTTLTYDWDGKDDFGFLQPKGVYLFKWTVGALNTPTQDCDKSGPLTVTQTHSDLTGDYNEATDENMTEDGCVLTDSGIPRLDATTANVRVYAWDPSEDELGNNSPITLTAGPVTLPTTTNPSGEPNPVWDEATFPLVIREQEVHLFAAVNQHSAQDKGHRNRPALQRGKTKAHGRADCFTYKTGPPPGVAAKHILAGMGYKANAFDQQTAQKVLSLLQQDTVLFYSGDGALDVTRDANYYGGISGAVSSVLLGLRSTTIPSQQGGTGITFKFITDMPQHKLAGRTKLAVWLACVTGMNGQYLGPTLDYQTGNLVDECTGWGGATCALGFMSTITASQGVYNSWASAFFTALRNGNGVTTAAGAAANVVDPGHSLGYFDFRTSPAGSQLTLP